MKTRNGGIGLLLLVAAPAALSHGTGFERAPGLFNEVGPDAVTRPA